MKSEESVRKPGENSHQRNRFLKKRPGLQLRMTTSYVVVSVASALLVELLIAGIFLLVSTRLPFVEQAILNDTDHAAHIYALEAAVQANGDTLNPRSTFQPGQPASLVLTGADSSQSVPYTVARPLLHRHLSLRC